MTFRVGQKVVCINVEWRVGHNRKLARPVQNGIYTVRDFFAWPGAAHGPHVRLEEIRNEKQLWSDATYDEVAFSASRFRPIVGRKTDISIFTEMLTPQGVDA